MSRRAFSDGGSDSDSKGASLKSVILYNDVPTAVVSVTLANKTSTIVDTVTTKSVLLFGPPNASPPIPLYGILAKMVAVDVLWNQYGNYEFIFASN